MKRKTVLDLRKKADNDEKLVMVTAYDFTMARLVDAAGVDLVLVGDSGNLKVHAFDFEGNVVHTIVLPLIATALAFRPGIFAPLSDVSLTTASPTTSRTRRAT